MGTKHAALVVAGLMITSAPAHAYVAEGQPAPAFTKSQLDWPAVGQTTPRSLADYPCKVLVVFTLGYNCPVCLADGPSIEADLRQHYATAYPGQVQVVGADVWNGTASQLRSFKTSTGATYPLLLLAGTETGGNMNLSYGPNDAHIVINKHGIVRLNTVKYPHGQRYRLNEIRACIDSLVMNTADVADAAAPRVSLSASPNPFRGETTVELASATGGSRAHVTVHDLAGRRVATLFDGVLAQGTTRLSWDGRGARGPMPAGVYLVRAEVHGERLARRIVRIP